MNNGTTTARVKIVSIILPFELVESVTGAMAALNVHGYTSTRVDGQGHHGPRTRGLLDAANVRLDIIATPSSAQKLFELVETQYADDGVVVFAVDADAAPLRHFG